MTSQSIKLWSKHFSRYSTSSESNLRCRKENNDFPLTRIDEQPVLKAEGRPLVFRGMLQSKYVGTNKRTNNPGGQRMGERAVIVFFGALILLSMIGLYLLSPYLVLRGRYLELALSVCALIVNGALCSMQGMGFCSSVLLHRRLRSMTFALPHSGCCISDERAQE